MRIRLPLLLVLALLIFGCINLPQIQGCKYNNPPCSSGQECITNTCVQKQGCEYDNPVCDNRSECIANVCFPKMGCAYDYPACPSYFNCVNNICVLKDGCQYDNPQCDEGYACANNTCIIDQTYNFTIEKNTEPYYTGFCDKIDPYDLSVHEAAADAIRNDSGAYSISQLFDIYDWVKSNITYQKVPLKGVPYHPSETLITKSGDCKNQAVLIASMVKAIGGTSQVVVDPYCEHGYAIVYLGPAGMDMGSFKAAIKEHYGPDVRVSHFTADNGTWVIFDPAGASYPGKTLPECFGNRTVYFVTGCLDCAHQNPAAPYTFEDKCYSTCPLSAVSSGEHACTPCQEGYQSCNNKCSSCPSGYYLASDCMCHPN